MIRPPALSQSVTGYAPTCCCHCEVVDPHVAKPITGHLGICQGMLKSLHPLLGLSATRLREKQRVGHATALWLTRFAVLALTGIGYTAPSAAELREGHFRIGVLVAVSPSTTPSMAAFVQELQKLGYIEGGNTVIDARSAEGDTERLPALAKELEALAPNVIFAVGTPPVMALKSLGTSIPVVFVGVGADPVRSGWVKSIPRPGTNFTGMLNVGLEIAAKRLQLLKELLPSIRRAVVLRNANNAASIAIVDEIIGSSSTVGIEVVPIDVRRAKDLPPAIEQAERLGVQALMLTADAMLVANRRTIIDLVDKKKLPAMYSYPFEAAEGGLISYGPDIVSNYRDAATYIDKILRGVKAADLPVQQPTRLSLVINLKTAGALGIKVPPMLLARADEVIE
jgi:putative ABC transport system substrate-binding protein